MIIIIIIITIMIKVWHTRTKEIPIVIGALGALRTAIRDYLAMFAVKKHRVDNIQKAALLGSAHILKMIQSNPA